MFLNTPQRYITAESHSQDVKLPHFELVKRPEQQQSEKKKKIQSVQI